MSNTPNTETTIPTPMAAEKLHPDFVMFTYRGRRMWFRRTKITSVMEEDGETIVACGSYAYAVEQPAEEIMRQLLHAPQV